jgi:hypothetical protein
MEVDFPLIIRYYEGKLKKYNHCYTCKSFSRSIYSANHVSAKIYYDCPYLLALSWPQFGVESVYNMCQVVLSAIKLQYFK